MYSFTLYSAVIVAVVPGIVNSEQQQDDSAVLVKINPFISKSRRIIQFGGDGRYKRNGPEKSALYLEFPESFFEDPKLKRLYRSLIGGGGSAGNKSFDPERTDIVFQIDPSALGEDKLNGKHKKRDVRGELAAFQLKIGPAAAHVKQMGRGLQGFVPRHETTKQWCIETMPQADTSPDPVMTAGSEEPSTETVAETMCYPSKPSTPKLRICGGTTTENYKSARPNDPCQCNRVVDEQLVETTTVETTPYELYTQCRSRDPVVTHYVESLCFTTEKCSPKTTFRPYVVDVFSTTYRPIVKPSCPPSSTACTTVSTCAPFAPLQKFLKRRRKDNQLKNFFVSSNSPQNCPPFCPPKCSSSQPCARFTHCKPACSCATTACNENRCPVKRARPDDPLRNVLRLFHRRNPRRVRRNPSSIRRRRRVWVYKPKRRLGKVSFRSGKYVPSLE